MRCVRGSLAHAADETMDTLGGDSKTLGIRIHSRHSFSSVSKGMGRRIPAGLLLDILNWYRTRDDPTNGYRCLCESRTPADRDVQQGTALDRKE